MYSKQVQNERNYRATIVYEVRGENTRQAQQGCESGGKKAAGGKVNEIRIAKRESEPAEICTERLWSLERATIVLRPNRAIFFNFTGGETMGGSRSLDTGESNRHPQRRCWPYTSHYYLM